MSGFEQPIVIPIAHSRRLARALVAIHAGAVLPLLLVDDAGWQAVLLLVTLASAVSCRTFLRAGDGRRVTSLSLTAAGVFHVRTANGEEPATLRVASVVQPWLTALVLRGDSGTEHRVVLLGDNCPPTPFRRLRARLRLDARLSAAASAGASPARSRAS